jgi:hypothetical protein
VNHANFAQDQDALTGSELNPAAVGNAQNDIAVFGTRKIHSLGIHACGVAAHLIRPVILPGIAIHKQNADG